MERKSHQSRPARGSRRDALHSTRPAVRVPAFPADLPICAKREEIARAIREHQVVIVCGETGSGKTTQLPKICLAMGRGTRGLIGHTQPRRIAARSTAARIAQELESPIGKHVGYKIRFSDTLTPSASIKIMTDGILLAETRRDPLLRAYDTLIIDEAHERSLNVDFILGYLKRILPKRSEMKVIITSATIDPQRFSEHFGGPKCAPIIEVTGRTYPVEVRYRPLEHDDPDTDDRDLRQGVLDAVEEAIAHGPGDILIFLTGEREIRETAKALVGRASDSIEILPLYARLTAEEQNRIFAPHECRRIVLATNVAETSLTVPGIRYVIDSGQARISRYSARSGVQRLPIEPISRASAEQRKGRCGRLGPGLCIRLYSENDLQAREEFTLPEILRTNLAGVILQMKALKLGRIEDFPFVEPPRWGMITDAYASLHELGAMDTWGEITPLGEELARLPIDPRLGRMILAARQEGCLNDVLVIAAALSIQDPRERPHEKQEAADEAHREFQNEQSDFLTLLNLWRAFQEKSKALTQNRLRKWCREKFLSYVRMREWMDVHHQLRDLIAEAEITAGARRKPNAKSPLQNAKSNDDSIHRAILSGLLSRIGVKGDFHEYTGAFGRKFHIFPGSGLFKQSPQWIMAAELVETTRLYAHAVAGISPGWLEKLGSHLVKRRYAEPHWREKKGDVAALESVTLFGLEIVKDRRVPYGPIDPKVSRDIFIQNALVEGRNRTSAPFFKHNRQLIEDIRVIEHKVRKHGILIHDAQLFAFYNDRIPEGIYSGVTFEAYRRKAEHNNPRLLFMSHEQLVADAEHGATSEQYPDHLIVNTARLPLTYRFEPGDADDGVTVTVPVAIVNQLPQQQLDWLVPGMIEEKVAALIKGLPKDLRRHFVPVQQFAKACVERMTFGKDSLAESVGHALRQMTGIDVFAQAWDDRYLPDYLRMNVRVVDDRGKVIAKGRNLREVSQHIVRPTQGVAPLGTGLRSNQLPSGKFRSWSFGDLHESIIVKQSGIEITAYPAIVDKSDGVSIEPMQTREQAERETRCGLLRLIMLQYPREMKALAEQFPNMQRMTMHFAALRLGSGEDLKRDLLAAVIDCAFLNGTTRIVRTQAAFEKMIESGWHNTAAALDSVCRAVDDSCEKAIQVRSMLADMTAPQLSGPVEEITSHLDDLLHKDFIRTTAVGQLVHFPRYIEGDRLRIMKITSGKLQRDRQLAGEFEPLWKRYLEQVVNHGRDACATESGDALDMHRWILEELRVSLFAQELGTANRVSAKRVEEHWRTIASG